MQPGFNFLSLLCFLDCNSKHVHPAGGNTASIENEKCKDLYGILFGSLPKLIIMESLAKGQTWELHLVFSEQCREILRSLDLKAQVTGIPKGHPPQRGPGRAT